MNGKELAVAMLSLLVAIAVAHAADPAPSGVSGPTSTKRAPEQASPAPRRAGEAVSNADARHCLEFSTNLQVIACAEKYRPHKRSA